MQNATSNRRFFITSNHFLGLGPRDTHPYDRVAILAGGRMPYVLRKIQNAAGAEDFNRFNFVGDCYVEGVMYGELLEAGF